MYEGAKFPRIEKKNGMGIEMFLGSLHLLWCSIIQTLHNEAKNHHLDLPLWNECLGPSTPPPSFCPPRQAMMIALKNKGGGGIDGYLRETKKKGTESYDAICQGGNVTVNESGAYVT